MRMYDVDMKTGQPEQTVHISSAAHRGLKAIVAERGGKLGEVTTEIIETYLKREDARKARALARKASNGE